MEFFADTAWLLLISLVSAVDSMEFFLLTIGLTLMAVSERTGRKRFNRVLLQFYISLWLLHIYACA